MSIDIHIPVMAHKVCALVEVIERTVDGICMDCTPEELEQQLSQASWLLQVALPLATELTAKLDRA